LLFLRNNQVLPDTLTLEPAKGDWLIELTGLLEKPVSIVADLAKLPQQEQELVLQCSGNGRAWFARSVKAEGAQWQNGAMGNVAFRGPPLAAVLERCGASIEAAARFIAAKARTLRPKRAPISSIASRSMSL